MRSLLLAAVGLLLAACESAPPVKSVQLVEGDIVATAPAGFCVDQTTSRPATGFAVMAPCATLGGGDAIPDVLGVATVQVGAAGSGSVAGAEDDLRDLLQSDAGAQLLSPSGQGDQIDVKDAEAGENTVRVYFSDAGTPPIDGMQSEEWRAFTDIAGRLVTVGVRGLAAAPMEKETGAWLLGLVVNGLVPTQTAVSPTSG